ncbi:MAG: Beta-hexosaminidase [Bacteroidetes bacterium ADurb.Bin037]|nr:MAG: Beta-hexosaminidase [Bacteroidetes bacterium ADurb.Bin037]HPW78030.1 family 20 glycosylhydrolase [Bacteroidales bacterium]HQB55278.1 family 20 glycosylhydrolase [Bacteroidales bacterium]
MNTLIALLMTSLIHLIPAPVEMIPGKGSFILQNGTALYIQDPSKAKDAVSFLTSTLEPSTGIVPAVVKQYPAAGAVLFVCNDSLPAEGYTLTVTKDLIEIAANDPAGYFYGVQTLLQLLPPEVYRPVYQPDQYTPALELQVPCVRIRDYPRFSHRGMMLDVSRQFFTVDYVMRFIDWMAKHKLNRFHWHLADDNGWRIEIKKYPYLTKKGAWRGPGEVLPTMYGHAGERYGGYYTQEDIRRIVAYASARQVEIIPEIDLPGHSAAAIGSYPDILCDLTTEKGELSAQGMSNNVWCASYEKNYKMLEDIIREMVQLFPSQYFHIGGDEVVTSQWTNCTRCTAFMHEHNMKDPMEMQFYFVQRMQQILNKFGKTLVGWDEIMEGGELDREKTVILAWRRAANIKEATSAGYKVIVQPAQYYYLDMKHTLAERGMTWAAIFDIDKVYSFDPVETPGLTADEASKVLGIQGGLWAELLNMPPRIAEYQTYPRLCALAETAWSPKENKNWEDFKTRLSETHFDRLYHMGIRFRIPPPLADYVNGYICAQNEYPWMVIRYTCDGTDPDSRSPLYTGPISTKTPESYRFASFFRDDIRSIVREANLPYERYQKPITHVTGNINIHPRTPLSLLGDNNRSTYVRCFGPLKEGQSLLYTFEEPLKTKGITIQTGLPYAEINIVDFAYVEYSPDGTSFKKADCPWKDGGCRFVPEGPVKAVRIVFENGNQIPTYFLQDLLIENQ